MNQRLTVVLFLILVIVSTVIGSREWRERADPPGELSLSNYSGEGGDERESISVISESIEPPKASSSSSLQHLIGKTGREIENEFGKAERKDPTPYGYTWWIYSTSVNYYQIGIENDEVVAAFGIGPSLDLDTIKIGQSRKEIEEKLTLEKEVEIKTEEGSFLFTLTEEDFKQRPLSKMNDSEVIQLYFDESTNQLSSVRVMNNKILLLHRPYDVSYTGQLPELPLLLESEWKEIEKGTEQQIYAISNQLRSRFGVDKLVWDELTAGVAYQHSKDMAERNYFSHISLSGEGLKERLKKGDIQYASAGENIAAQYPDGPAVVEGWLNSEGHREALLNEGYTHLGVGVYRYYYTQNFLEEPY
ncbi:MULTISPECIES: CAP domain-containing protein [Pontibacillus]|uniref:CAP domain-containing protein n=1 Tax=Pontibacillus chungwhensis TaxID=265426 RepID=A0ABY8V2J8_9BACI|nr:MULTISPECIES: CAP domain-containing protein [Pontibacillus]MCD5322560.1 CAP domain-containing protein [Pontibacillus sp. HN14]WIF99845.1 CAP domain-containing protein [Pontibacillus chungwhensis]